MEREGTRQLLPATDDVLDDIGRLCLWDDFLEAIGAGGGDKLPDYVDGPHIQQVTQEIPGHHFESTRKKCQHTCGRTGCALAVIVAPLSDGRVGVFPQGNCDKRGRQPE